MASMTSTDAGRIVDLMRTEQLAVSVAIELTKNQVAIVDECDADLAECRWYARFNARYANGGAYVSMRSVTVSYTPYVRRWEYMHRVILSRVLGRDLSRDEQVDHIDHNPLNNCRDNLRLATSMENNRNRRRRVNGLSGFKGVSWHKRDQNWQARICVNGKERFLGSFDTAEAAARAYDAAACKYFGKFALPNFPIEETSKS